MEEAFALSLEYKETELVIYMMYYLSSNTYI